MKNKYHLNMIWSALLLIIIVYFAINYYNHRPKQIAEIIKKEVPSKIFNKTLMDSLIKTNKFVMITIGATGCDLCSDINKIVIHDSSKVTKVFLNIDHHKNNLLLAQSLFNKGYPTSYIIDKDYNLIGIIDGLKKFNKQLDSIIRFKQNPINFHSIDGDVEDKNIIPTLNFTFKATMNYFENDFEKLNKNVRISLKYGSFFFNNYLLYEYFSHKNNADSARFYKNKTLEYSHHINSYIYKDLIDKLKSNK